MNVRFTPEAEHQADECDLWWRENRDARDLFARELAETLVMLRTSPHSGIVYTMLDGDAMRRVLMPKTRHHVYFVSDPEAEELVIHAVWGAPRERGPDF